MNNSSQKLMFTAGPHIQHHVGYSALARADNLSGLTSAAAKVVEQGKRFLPNKDMAHCGLGGHHDYSH